MIMRRATGIAMLGLEVALLRLSMGMTPVGILIVLIALAGCLPGLQVAWPSRRRATAMGLVVIGFYLAYRLGFFGQIPFRSEPVSDPGTLAGALCFMLLQALQFYWRTPGGLPQYYPLLGVLALSYSADQYLKGPDAVFAFRCAMAFGALAALFYAAGPVQQDPRRPRHLLRRFILIALCLALSLGLASGTAIGMKEGDTIIAQWMTNRALMERIGLGNRSQSRLDSITDLKSRDSDRIMLQIESVATPGYLRGQAYADYQNDTWSALPFGVNARIVNTPPQGYRPLWRNANLFAIPPAAPQVNGTMTVFPSPVIERALFTPLETAWVACHGALQTNEARVVQSPAMTNGQPYQILTGSMAEVSPLTEAERAQYTRLPSALAPRIQTLSDTVCAGLTNTMAKTGAVAQYFTGRYDYVLGIQVPAGRDPLEYFLFSDPLPAAHCEFFATGAVFLLRAAGVPARYVTGVGVWEQHPFADYWVARNRDAHAWVEAWDENQGWFIVEATPTSGLPSAGLGQETSTLKDLWSLVGLQVRQFLTALREGAWRVAVEALAALLAGLYQFVQEAWLPLLSVLGLFMLLMRLVRNRKRRPVQLLPQGAIARRLHRQLGRMDRAVKRRYRLERAAHITPHAFAGELETALADPALGGSIAAWYRRWAEVRYQPELDGAAVDGLERGLRALKGRRKRKSG